MCHGHPRHHPCSHQSVTWHYCPAAFIDLETGYETPCSNVTFAASQPTNTDCPLQNCEFKANGGSWTCCVCQQGPNTQGWCTFRNSKWVKNHLTGLWEMAETCDHGCCENCTRHPSAAEPTQADPASTHQRAGGSRKGTAGPTPGEGDEHGASSSSSPSEERRAACNVRLDYGGKDGKHPQKKKGHRSW